MSKCISWGSLHFPEFKLGAIISLWHCSESCFIMVCIVMPVIVLMEGYYMHSMIEEKDEYDPVNEARTALPNLHIKYKHNIPVN